MIKDIRITDPYVRRRVSEISRKRGDASPTRTATAILLEVLPLIDDAGLFSLDRINRSIQSPEPKTRPA